MAPASLGGIPRTVVINEGVCVPRRQAQPDLDRENEDNEGRSRLPLGQDVNFPDVRGQVCGEPPRPLLWVGNRVFLGDLRLSVLSPHPEHWSCSLP